MSAGPEENKKHEIIKHTKPELPCVSNSVPPESDSSFLFLFLIKGKGRLLSHGWPFCDYLLLSTCRSVARAWGHRGRLEDDSVTAGGQSNCHLLVEDPAWSLHEDRRRGGDLSQL